METSLVLSRRKNQNDFGMLEGIANELNFNGDNSEMSISRRTACGLKKSLALQHIDDTSAENIVHAGIALTTILLKSKNQTANGLGILLIAGLLSCYWEGK
jgi:hypothetical protein